MKSCILYVKPSPLTDEMIACALIHIYSDSIYRFKWSRKKLNVALKLLPKKDINLKGLRNLITMEFKNIERNMKDKEPHSIINYLNHKKIHGTGLITVGDIKPFYIGGIDGMIPEKFFEIMYEDSIEYKAPL